MRSPKVGLANLPPRDSYLSCSTPVSDRAVEAATGGPSGKASSGGGVDAITEEDPNTPQASLSSFESIGLDSLDSPSRMQAQSNLTEGFQSPQTPNGTAPAASPEENENNSGNAHPGLSRQMQAAI